MKRSKSILGSKLNRKTPKHDPEMDQYYQVLEIQEKKIETLTLENMSLNDTQKELVEKLNNLQEEISNLTMDKNNLINIQLLLENELSSLKSKIEFQENYDDILDKPDNLNLHINDIHKTVKKYDILVKENTILKSKVKETQLKNNRLMRLLNSKKRSSHDNAKKLHEIKQKLGFITEPNSPQSPNNALQRIKHELQKTYKLLVSNFKKNLDCSQYFLESSDFCTLENQLNRALMILNESIEGNFRHRKKF